MGSAGATRQRGRPRAVPVARCPDPLHARGHVVGNGTQTSGGRRVRQYRCRPLVGDPHTFLVAIEDRRPRRRTVEAPPCPLGHTAPVQRAGLYGRGGLTRRQRYFCPEGGESDKGHVFTPPLPREHVPEGAGPCPTCDEERSVHRGDTAAARSHQWPSRVVARALDMLSAGASYGEASRWAFDEVGARSGARRRRRSRAPATGTPGPDISLASRESHRVWRTAANWVEAFAPVIWGPVEAQLRSTGLAERARIDADMAAGVPMERPQMVVIDDIPVWGRDGPGKRRDGGFYVLVVGETEWIDRGGGDWATRLRLRLLRAMAKSNTSAWRLVFDELGYAPDYIVADAGTGIGAAVSTHFASTRTVLVPSLWHVSKTITTALGMRSPANRHPAVVSHLLHLGRGDPALTDASAWATWWNQLADLCRSLGLPASKIASQRRNYERPVAAVLPHLAAVPSLTLASGGLETLIRERVDHVLASRTQFGNIERTNALLDLVVARAHGAFTDLHAVEHLLRGDAEDHDGYAVVLRAIDDPQPETGVYSSLRDANLLVSLARARGLV